MIYLVNYICISLPSNLKDASDWSINSCLWSSGQEMLWPLLTQGSSMVRVQWNLKTFSNTKDLTAKHSGPSEWPVCAVISIFDQSAVVDSCSALALVKTVLHPYILTHRQSGHHSYIIAKSLLPQSHLQSHSILFPGSMFWMSLLIRWFKASGAPGWWCCCLPGTWSYQEVC